MKSKKFIYGLCTLSGTIIGVGLFSLPYITSQVGIWIILGYFLGLGALAVVIHLLFSEVALKTPDFLRLPGFAKLHLGKWGKRTAFFSITFGLFGANLAYLIIGGKFLTSLLNPILGGSEFFYTILYFIFGAVIIYFGIKVIARVELLGLILFFMILFVILFKGVPHFEIGNLISSVGKKDLFLPYGPILFSLWGTALIPEIEEMLGRKKHLLKKIIPIAILIPIIAYLLFIFLVTGITGQNTSEEAISGLRSVLNNKIINFALLFGLLTTFTSFIVLGLTLKKVFWYDFKINKNLAWLITCFIPLLLFLIGIQSFIGVIAFVGGVTIGIEGILIILMYRKVVLKAPEKIKKKKFRFLTYPLILIFILGIIYQIIYFVR